MNPGMTEEQQ